MNRLEVRKTLVESGIQASGNQIDRAIESLGLPTDLQPEHVDRLKAHFQATARPNGKTSTGGDRQSHPTHGSAQQLQQAEQQSKDAISTLAKAGVNGINAQVFSVDARLNQFETQVADQLVDRVLEMPARIQSKVQQRLAEVQVQADFDFFGDCLQVPNLTGTFLAEARNYAQLNGSAD